MTIKLSKILLAFCCLACSSNAFAQDNSAMMGTVKDAKNAEIAGASVTAINLKTKKRETATSGEDGTFYLDRLVEGDYEIRIEKSGFAALTEKISLKAGEMPEPVYVLQVGGVSETVRVEDQNESYVALEAATTTKTNVDLRDVPQSIQVVSRKLLDDRATFNFAEAAMQNVSGVVRSEYDITGAGISSAGISSAGSIRRFNLNYNNNYFRDSVKFPGRAAHCAHFAQNYQTVGGEKDAGRVSKAQI